MSYEWVTVLTIRHRAGSEEGAIHQRNAMDKAIADLDGEVLGAVTAPGDAAAVALALFLGERRRDQEPDDDEDREA